VLISSQAGLKVNIGGYVLCEVNASDFGLKNASKIHTKFISLELHFFEVKKIFSG